jgi:hypothetical protein
MKGEHALGLMGRYGLLSLSLLGALLANPSAQDVRDMPAAAPLTVDQVVERMVQMNEERSRDLQSYTATRSYHLRYQGLFSASADLEVTLTYQWPDKKDFEIVSERGSELLRRRVLKPLLEAEKESLRAENRKQTSIRPENYEFRYVDYERTSQGSFYVLEIKPRNKNKFLIRGRIWVDGEDFGIARIEGEPSINPSWWTKRNLIHASFEKVGNFWLPARNDTETHLRMLGRSWLTIDYGNYRLLKVRGGESAPDSGEAAMTPAIVP